MKADTIAAVATPPGDGGIAILRISGPDAIALGARLFRPQSKEDPAHYSGYTVRYGLFVAPDGEAVDDGLLTLFRAPRSYTGEDTIELSCHGGRATTARLLRLVLAAGARLAEPGEFTQRAFFNGRLDLAQAEAVADVIRARTEATRRAARRQLDGALSRQIETLRDALIGVLAAIEVTIDFSDEVGDLEYAPLALRLGAARAGVENLLHTTERGRLLREGVRVAIVGRPNVGKSSLLNALLRTERAIVTPIPGTTRDLVEEQAQIGGVPVVLVDTAGIRETADAVERIGVARAQATVESSDITLLVLDAQAGWTPDDRSLFLNLQPIANRLLLAVNKSDLLGAKPAEALQAELEAGLPASARIVFVSAQTGANLDILEQTLVRTSDPGVEESGTPLVTSARHQAALEAALASLREAERTTSQHLPGDFVAIDVRGALDALGLITGETVTDDIVQRIFRDFCVGK